MILLLAFVLFCYGTTVYKSKKVKFQSQTSDTCDNGRCSMPSITRHSFDCSTDQTTFLSNTFDIVDMPDFVSFYNATIDIEASSNLDLYSPPSEFKFHLNNYVFKMFTSMNYLENRCCMSHYSMTTQENVIENGLNKFSIDVLTNILCFHSIQIIYNYGKEMPDISLIQPNSGPIEGGTHITVVGTKFGNSSNYLCHFGEYSSEFEYVDSSHGYCLTPKINQTGEFSFYMASEDDPEIPSQVKFIGYDINISNGELRTMEGNTYVMIFGSGFVATGKIQCYLSNYYDPKQVFIFYGEYVDKTSLMCLLDNDFVKQYEGTYNIFITLNGVDITKNNVIVDIVDMNNNKLTWLIILSMCLICLLLCTLLGGLIVIAVRKYKKDNKNRDLIKSIRSSDIVCEELIGKGSFAEVWKASWKGQEIAVKLISLKKMSRRNLEQMSKEVQLMSSLRHPCILQFFGSGMDANYLLIAMELMENGTVHDLLNNKFLDIPFLVRLRMLKDAANGMFYLHHCKPPIIHRDLKSHNLLVDENWNVKVSDFGLSIPLYGDEFVPTNLCGTLAWIAPEALLKKPYNLKVDVYSFGIVMWEMLTRKEPFSDLTPYMIMTKVAQNGMRPDIPEDDDKEKLKNWKDKCREKYIELMECCWNESPENRPVFDDIVDQLSAIIDILDNEVPDIL